MGQPKSEPSASEGIDDFFEPMLSETIEEDLDDGSVHLPGKSRLAELRRRAEQRMEDKRMREELDYLDLDWKDA